MSKSIRDQLNEMTVDELSYTLGRYCGPGNELLSYKKFGDLVHPDLVLEILKTKVVEEALFFSPGDDKID